MTRIAVVCLGLVLGVVANASCHLLTGVAVCGNGERCPNGETCDVAVGVCRSNADVAAQPGTCGQALPLVPSQQTDIDTTDAPSSLFAQTCEFQGGTGAELVFVYTPPAAGTLSVRLRPLEPTLDLQMYLRHDCSDDASEIACVDRIGEGRSETLVAPLEAGETVFLVIDGFGADDLGPATFLSRFVVDEGQTCSPEVECTGGTVCENGTCTPLLQPGERCESAVVLDRAGGTLQGDTRLLVNDFAAGPLCTSTTEAPNGFDMLAADAIFAVQLEAGELLSLSLLSPVADLGLILQPTCPPPADGSCLQISDAGVDTQGEALSFGPVEQATALFVTVDGFQPVEEGPFALSWAIARVTP